MNVRNDLAGVAVVIVALFLAYNSAQNSEEEVIRLPPLILTEPVTTPTPPTSEVKSFNGTNLTFHYFNLEGEPFMGSEDAPGLIVAFINFQCPGCKKFYDETFQFMKDNYVDTGKLRFVVKDYPSTNFEQSLLLAEAANCAKDQGKYWEYFSMIFEEQERLSEEENSPVLEWAKRLGLDTEQFLECLKTHKYAREALEDADEGAKAGVDATPTFFVNGKRLVGAHPLELFKKIFYYETSPEFMLS